MRCGEREILGLEIPGWMDGWDRFFGVLSGVFVVFICGRLSIYMHHVPKVSGLEFFLSSSTKIDGKLRDGEEAGFLTRDEGIQFESVFV